MKAIEDIERVEEVMDVIDDVAEGVEAVPGLTDVGVGAICMVTDVNLEGLGVEHKPERTSMCLFLRLYLVPGRHNFIPSFMPGIAYSSVQNRE